MADLKIGLALSGGGSKGAFTVGVLRALRQALPSAQIRIISGTSTGALIGTLATLGQWTRLTKIYTGVVTENIVNPNHALVARVLGPEAVLFASAIFGGNAIFDTAGLERMIRDHVDFKKLKQCASQTLLIYNAVSLQTGEVRAFDTASTPETVLPKALLASSNMPVLTPPVPIGAGAAREDWVDGGVREYLPIRAIFDSGIEVDRIIAIANAPYRPQKGKQDYSQIVDVLGRTVDLLATEVGYMDTLGAQLINAALQMLENADAENMSRRKILRDVPSEIRRHLDGKRAVPVDYVGPSKHLDMDSLTFDERQMRKAMDHGMSVGKRAFRKLRT